MRRRKVIFTVGHSIRPIDEFIGLLKTHGIEEIADIRTMPRSRHNPQFNKEALAKSLAERGIKYGHFPKLGGLRKAKKDSENLGWRNISFRGFADYMATENFAAGLQKLMKTASRKKTAIMCAEAVPWRCHRSLVTDALTKKKWLAKHIQNRKTAAAHKLTPFLRVRRGKLVYPPTNSDKS